MTVMTSSSMNIKLSLVVAFLCVVIGGRAIEATISCDQVMSNLAPCVSYVTSGGSPSSTCCNGVKNLNAMAQTTTDRQQVCRCLESLIKGVSYNAQNIANAGALPTKCGVHLPYNISPNINCNTIKM